MGRPITISKRLGSKLCIISANLSFVLLRYCFPVNRCEAVSDKSLRGNVINIPLYPFLT